MRGELGQDPSGELDVLAIPLMDTVVHRLGFEASRLGLEAGYLLPGKDIGQDQVAFDFDLTNPIAQSQPRPVR